MATLLLPVMGAFAEFERELIRERQRAGRLRAARARGAYRGRRPSLSTAQEHELCAADDQGLARGCDHLGGHRVEFVDLEDPVDLGEDAGYEAEVAGGDAGDRSQSVRIAERAFGQLQAEFGGMTAQQFQEFELAEWPVFVGEPDPAVQLGVAGQAPVAGRACRSARARSGGGRRGLAAVPGRWS